LDLRAEVVGNEENCIINSFIICDHQQILVKKLKKMRLELVVRIGEMKTRHSIHSRNLTGRDCLADVGLQEVYLKAIGCEDVDWICLA
jgi:hypothetical protein